MPLPDSYFPPPVPAGLEGLAELALDFGVASFPAFRDVWGRIDAETWQATRNPWLVLQTAELRDLAALAADTTFRERFADARRAYRERLAAPAWLQRTHRDGPLGAVAYFSMEFGLSDALPIYSGGLGNVAGDQLKSASDLGVPVVGIGLLYQVGYFRQEIGLDGWQRESLPYNDPVQLPVLPVRDPDGGEWLRVLVDLPGRRLWLRAWEARVGRVRLYLLDSNDLVNTPADRGITGELYGGGPELRLLQEIVLGIGGWRLLGRLGVRPEVCHLNEGHAAFAVLERAREFMRDTGQPFPVALTATRAGNLFTTHTPVEAGFDRFEPALVARHLGGYADELGIGIDGLLALGRRDPADAGEPLNMATLAIRGSAAVNGVSRLHGEVSRRLFAPLFPRHALGDVPVGYVTNGVHLTSWASGPALEVWGEASRGAGGTFEDPSGALATALGRVPDESLWAMRTEGRQRLVRYARARLAQQLAAAGGSAADVGEAERCLDPNVLTLGFARRFAAYKRPNLLLRDPERLRRLLCDGQRPVQIVIAGKAHPRDETGKELLRQWIERIRGADLRHRAVFLPDYDITLAQHLVQGVDVWLNTPRRPWEASGTSGMKVLVNGGLNLSELDGWWAEAYEPEVGWALGDGREHDDDPAWDATEAEALYALLEQVVVPAFYARDGIGVPRAWVARMRESMARLAQRFSSARTVREYVEHYYLPLAAAYAARADKGGRLAAELEEWRARLASRWREVHFGSVRVHSSDGRHRFEVQVSLGDLGTEDVRVELFAEPLGGGPPERVPLERDGALPGAVHGHLYVGDVLAERPASDWTPRCLPAHPAARMPLEAPLVCWQR